MRSNYTFFLLVCVYVCLFVSVLFLRDFVGILDDRKNKIQNTKCQEMWVNYFVLNYLLSFFLWQKLKYRKIMMESLFMTK